MELRWSVTEFLETEKRFRKIMGYKDLWILKAKLRSEASVDTDKKLA